MKILQKEITGTKLVFPPIFGGKLGFILSSLFLGASTAATYIFTAFICRTIIIVLEPCALNAEFQHFIPRFNKNFLTLRIPLKEGVGGVTDGDFIDNIEKKDKFIQLF
jgi:hypothetical protein